MPHLPQIVDPILDLDPSETPFGGLVVATERELKNFDSDHYRADFGSGMSMRHRRILLRYGLPLIEILQLAETSDVAVPFLASHVLWSHFWRRADDLVDQPASICANASETTHHFAQAFGYTLSRLPSHTSPAALRSICRRRVQDMMNVEEGRRLRPLPITDNWKRVSPFFIAYDVFAGEHDKIGLYKSYLNIMILAHDLTDVFDDARNGVKSLPLETYFGSQKPLVFRGSLLHFLEQARVDVSHAISLLREKLAKLGANFTLQHLDFVEKQIL